MDDPMNLFAWTLGGTAAFALLGAAFGASAAWFGRRAGHAGGTALAHRVAEALSRLFEQPPSEDTRAVLVGSVDGAMFLGVVGLVVGLVVGARRDDPAEVILPGFLLAVFLTGAATAFGLLAMGMLRIGHRVVLPMAGCGVVGAFLATSWFGSAHLVPGAVAGIVVGTLLAVPFNPKPPRA